MVVTITKDIAKALGDLREEDTLKFVKDELKHGEGPINILEKCKEGMEIVGQRFERCEYFVSDLIMASAIFNRIMDFVKPLIKTTSIDHHGKVVIGTVEGDIHDIGKNIVKSLFEAQGFNVIDLGVDVPPTRFAEEVKKAKPNIVGMSALLTTATDSMKRIVDTLEQKRQRKKVKVIIGGAIVNKMVAKYVGADAFTASAIEGVKICKDWVSAW